MARSLFLRLLAAFAAVLVGNLAAPAWAEEPTIAFAAPSDEGALDAAMPQLARQVIAAQSSNGPNQDPTTLFRLELVAGDPAAGERTLADLRPRYRAIGAQPEALTLDDILLAAAKQQTEAHETLEAALTSAFRRVYVPLADKAAVDADYWIYLAYWSGTTEPLAKQRVQADLAALQGKTAISIQDAASLVRDYEQHRELRDVRPILNRLISDDDHRRFLVSDVLIRTKNGATLSAMVARPRAAAARAPATLLFTIYADPPTDLVYAKYAAARGYVGVVADARGKRFSPDEIRPLETEGADADGVIDWISRQPWSDGQVGMFGGSYSGFAQWAAAKHLPPALKTIVPYVANNPGDGLPMQNNVFLDANYAWNFYVTDNRYLDEEFYHEAGRWNGLGRKWFESGRPYREIDTVDGKPNPILQRQLKHPSYDAYWQALLPYKDDFAKIDIPILEISGYSGDDAVSGYFLPEHEHYNPGARHYLVIGPYDHGGSQSNFKSPVLYGYPIDPVAQLDTPALTFQWFDYVMRGGPRPALLKDRINFEVMGANVWRHAPSVERMSDRTLELYLTDAQSGGRYRLSAAKPAQSGFVGQSVDFADRKSANNLYPDGRLLGRLQAPGALWFISDPITEPLSVNGQITGVIKAAINKRDMDFSVAVYEVMPDGRFFNLAYYLGRASYAWDMSRRRLLTPGKIETIPFTHTGLVSRQLSRGSRLLVLLTVNKNSHAQVNYGTGKDVSDESIADAKEPLEVRWYNDSVIRVPVSASPPP